MIAYQTQDNTKGFVGGGIRLPQQNDQRNAVTVHSGRTNTTIDGSRIAQTEAAMTYFSCS